MLLHGNLARKEGRKRAGKRDFGANSLTSTAARILAAALLLGGIITVVRVVQYLDHILRSLSGIWKNKNISVFDVNRHGSLFVGASVSFVISFY